MVEAFFAITSFGVRDHSLERKAQYSDRAAVFGFLRGRIIACRLRRHYCGGCAALTANDARPLLVLRLLPVLTWPEIKAE